MYHFCNINEEKSNQVENQDIFDYVQQLPKERLYSAEDFKKSAGQRNLPTLMCIPLLLWPLHY